MEEALSLSKIQWTDRTWNPVRGCSRVSEGCRNCYAERFAGRFAKPGEPFHLYAKGPTVSRFPLTDPYHNKHASGWTGKVALVPEKLDEPLRWRKPSRVFVNSMSDLFHEALSSVDIQKVFTVMAYATQHTFQILTKRPEKMQRFLSTMDQWLERDHARDFIWPPIILAGDDWPKKYPGIQRPWPLPNVHLGVSVEDQATAVERIPLLLKTPAAVRFVSYEPALGPVDFGRWVRDPLRNTVNYEDSEVQAPVPWLAPGIDWLIVGGESGPGARPCDVAWIRSAVRQCREAGVACFVKQVGSFIAWNGCGLLANEFPSGSSRSKELIFGHEMFHVTLKDRKGGDPSEWPDDIRIRQFPETPR